MSKKIPIKINGKSDLVAIFKNTLIKYNFNTWKEFTDKIGIDNPRAFIDFFNGKQCLDKDIIEKAFEELNIQTELLDVYVEPIIKYKIKEIK